MTAVLFCRKCGGWYAVGGVIPIECPQCHRDTSWTTDQLRSPRVPYALSAADRRLLRHWGIAADA